MEENYFGDTSKKSIWFYFALALILICAWLSINTDLLEFSQKKDVRIPDTFFYLIFFVDFVIVSSVVLIYFYKKLGAYLLPFFVVSHFLLHHFYLSTFLYSDLNLLFVYFAAGLLVIIPRWKYFK